MVPHPVFLISGLSLRFGDVDFSSCNPKLFAVRHIHYLVNPSSDHFYTDAVVPSSDHCRTETVLPPSDRYCIETVAPSGDHYCIDIVVPSSSLWILSVQIWTHSAQPRWALGSDKSYSL